MIYFSAGHEKGIGLEVLFRSLANFSQNQINSTCLVVNPHILNEYLNHLKLDFKIDDNHLHINDRILPLLLDTNCSHTSSFNSLMLAINEIKKNNYKDILVTLPTSKNQLVDGPKTYKGYTDFLRSYFKSPYLPMVFYHHQFKCMLITDHVPLREVPDLIQESFIFNKISIAIEELGKNFVGLDEIFITGLNPHAGEDGLLGKEEEQIKLAIHKLQNKFSKKKFFGPLPADTISYLQNDRSNQFFVFMYHDQGLSFFKNHFGLKGINITLGLPFLRMSVDHGTAFELFGKNKADPVGMIYTLDLAFKLNKNY